MWRDIKGRFCRQRRGQKALLVLWVSCWSFCLIGAGWEASGLELGKTLVAVNAAEAAEMSFAPDKIGEAKWQVVDDLEQCECGGHTWAEGFFLLDANDRYSWGCLQFQERTVVHYTKQLTGRVIDLAEAKIIALDRERARQLAYDVIFTTESGVASDWVNCSKWYGLQARVDLIKSLEN